ncbi:MAG: hypothetical protein MZU97_05110 [Bacillus subtilis]|nr:hypothetical protein [Bacillus subtilis]
MKRRVVITGLGAVTPRRERCSYDVEAIQGGSERHRSDHPVRRLRPDKVRIAAEVKNFNTEGARRTAAKRGRLDRTMVLGARRRGAKRTATPGHRTGATIDPDRFWRLRRPPASAACRQSTKKSATPLPKDSTG